MTGDVDRIAGSVRGKVVDSVAVEYKIIVLKTWVQPGEVLIEVTQHFRDNKGFENTTVVLVTKFLFLIFKYLDNHRQGIIQDIILRILPFTGIMHIHARIFKIQMPAIPLHGFGIIKYRTRRQGRAKIFHDDSGYPFRISRGTVSE
ncbi:MAG: hypothetical protein BWY09_02734 [Candidatus Hydrogenedentes bacterium ADurb.Bin179]|nr:MAG: hypothetical protein BWY09_02734 [Candidatus Hydrogenedentes bacterium ADurb.Bin179]